MKNKIQIMFVRGLQKALNHDNGPRLPQHWKVIASTLLLLFTFAIGNVLAVDVTIAQPANPGSTMNNISYGLFILSHNNGAAYSSGAIKAANNGDEVTITLTTTKSDMYIKSVEFESPSNGSISSDDGTKSGNVFTITGNKNSVAIKLKSNSGAKGSVKFKQAVINSGSNDLEAITFSSYTTSTKAFAFSSSSATSALTSITQSTNKSPSVSSNILSWPNQGDVVFTSSRKIQYIALLLNDAKNYTAFKETNNSGDALTNHVWTGNSNAVTIYNGTGGGRSIKNVYVVFAPATYTLAWNLDGGSVDVAGTAAGSYTAGTTITAPTVSKTGYTFNGWDPAVPATMPAANSEYTATWTANTHSLTWNIPGDATITNPAAYTHGTVAYGTAIVAPTLTRDGYDFLGWDATPAATMPDNDLEYTATWQAAAAKHSITYAGYGSADISGYPTEYSEGIGIASFEPLADTEDQHFLGWSPASIATTATTDQTITATWEDKKVVTFDAGLGTSVATQKVVSGTVISAPASTRTNWTLEGWTLNPSAEPVVLYDFSTAITSDMDFTAVWSRNTISGSENDIVLVSTSDNIGSTSPLTDVYYGNDGSFSYTGKSKISTGGAMFGTPSSKHWVGFTLPSGYTATVTANATNSNERHCVLVTEAERAGNSGDATFLLDITTNSSTTTATSSSFGAGSYALGSTSGGIDINSVVVHVTESPITITFKNGEATYATITATSGEKLGNLFLNGELPSLAAATGYSFNGWKNGEDAVTKNTSISASMTINADWTATTYNVTLSAGSGASTAGAATVQMGASSLTIATATTGIGALTGFYTTADGDVKIAEADGALVAGTSYVTDGKWSYDGNITLYAQYAASYDVTYNLNGASGDAPTETAKAAGAEFTLAAAPSRDGYVFQGWKWTDATPEDHVVAAEANFTMPAYDVEFTAQWAQLYAITEGTPEHGSVDADVASAIAGATVTLTATPAEDYVFSAWDVYKTDESSTKVSVTNNTFTMPAYAVTVNATFVDDPRAKVLYVTSNSESDTKSDDKLYAALKDTYNVKIVGPASDADQSGYALIVLHESIDGKNDYNKTAVATAKTGSIPVLNTKSYFYPSGRWNWGTPNAGTSVKGATMNSAYCNIADHPLFNDVTVSEGFIEITDDAAAKCMQPVGSFTSGYEGYTLATTPNAESGNGCAIHEIPAGTTARGVSSGKYLMISVSNAKLDALNANGQKLFQNAAAYLIDGSASWTPIVVPTAAAITADPNAAYFVGDNIALTASATGTSAATTYTWYKGDNLADAKEAGALKATATAAAGGNNYGVTDCALGNTGTYWCVISNGTDCEAAASLEVTVSDVSYDIAFVSAHGTAPSATTGVSYTLPELSADGWAHQGWTANINVTVDAEEVTAGTTIANGKLAVFGADVTFTAVWVQVFDVTFNRQDHGAAVATQHIQNGGKVTEPNDPFEVGQIFGGWYKEAACTNEWDFANDVVTDDTELFAKWTAFTGCTELWPATSGDAPAAVGDAIVMQSGSNGAAMTALAKPDKLSYTGSGLQFSSESGVKVKVVLNNDMTVGTKISLTLVANGGKTRGLNLYTKDADKINDFTCWVDGTNPASDGAEETFTYTVVADDGLDGTNEFQLWRNNTVCLKSLKIESCGASVIYHDLTSAVSPDHDPAYATVTLGASSVREGYTTTATYSDIASGYEFDEWQISGTGASIADASANPAVITMGTADAVVTLKLKVETPSHTVSFNKMGKGDDIAPQNVKEGAKVTEPTVTEPEGWILEGWYTENTFETKWDFANDVMSTSNIELFANWVADTSIKLFSNTGELNTTNFVSAAKKDGGIDINEVNYPCLEQFAANRSSLGGAVPADMVQYNATTNAAKIKITFYNTNSSAKRAYLYRVKEGDTEATPLEISVPGQEIWTTEYYTFNGEENRSFYITAGDRSNIRILQVRVVDDGTPIKQAGQAGYSLNFNKGRMYVKNGTATTFEGMTMNTSSEYKVFNNNNIATTSNFSFTTTVDKMVLRVTRSGGNYYVSQNPESKGTIYNKNQEIVLTPAGTWYIGSETSGGAASFTKFEFIAPKCEAPEFEALANSDICSGDPYVALDGTGTVSDGGSITYKWYAEGDAETVLATTATYTPSADGNYYVVALHHVDGYTDNEVTSDVVTVTTHAAAVITTAPLNKRGEVGDEVTLTVAATGKNVAYKWYTCNEDGSNEVALDPEQTETSINVTITAAMAQWYKVKVTSDCGGAEALAKVSEFVPATPANVTGSILWDWTNSAWSGVGAVAFTNKDVEELMADADAVVPNNDAFRSDMLYGTGQYVHRNTSDHFFQGSQIRFNNTVAGLVRVHFRSTGNDKDVELSINGTVAGSGHAWQWSSEVEVAAGGVTIIGTGIGGNTGYTRIDKIEFRALEERRAESWIVPGELGTVCLKNDAKVVGANLYELQGHDENGYMAFDQIQSGELEAGKPYLFEATAVGQISFYTAVGANHTDEAGSQKGMYGTFENKVFNSSNPKDLDVYYFSGRHIWAVKNYTVDIPVNAYRCYVKMDEFKTYPADASPAPGRRRVTLGVNGNNAPTDVENVQSDEVQCTKVMINGQLFILRGEKMFDATGRLVK